MSPLERPRARVTISFDYPIKMEYYPSDEVETPTEAAAFDERTVGEETELLRDMLEWADPDTISISIEALPEES